MKFPNRITGPLGFFTIILFGLPLLIIGSPARANDSLWTYRETNIIDLPTAGVVDHYGYMSSFRFYQNGNLQAKMAFGVLRRLNLGFGLDAEELIGHDSSRLNRPTINVKFRFFDGHGIFPAFAAGFDGQGYMFNKTLDEYEQREVGFYVVGTSEIIVPDSFLHFGVNKVDFDENNNTYGFWGWTYTYQQKIGLMFEWVNTTEYKERRINFGGKYFVTPEFTVDFAGRNIPETPRSSKRITERIVRLTYTSSF